MHFDEILFQVGEFGRHQIIVCGFLYYVCIIMGLSAMSMVFLLGIDDYRCAIPGLSNDTYLADDESHGALVNATIPKDSKCTVYDVGLNGTGDEMACTRWVYDETTYRPSAIMEFNLVCDRTILGAVGKTAYMVGMVLGAIIGGKLADRFGRKMVIIISMLLQAIFGLVIAFAPDIYTFSVFRCLLAASHTSFYASHFILMMEIVGPTKRVFPGLAAAIFYAVGAMLATPLAYFFRNWRHLTIATVIPSVLLLPYWWLIPESPRWLLNVGKKKEAQKILQKMAKVNRRPFSESMLKAVNQSEDHSKTESFWKMIKQKQLLARLAIVCFTWSAVSAGYYGLHLYSGNMIGDIYINFTIGILMDIPAQLYSMFAPLKFGRKAPHLFVLFLGGLSCIGCMFAIMYGNAAVLLWLPTTLSTLGKFGISAAFGSAYMYGAELFPTSTRNMCVGTASMFARLVTIGAPFLADLGSLIPGPFSKVMPLVVFGTMLLLAGILGIFLPDTHGQPLPESIEEAMSWRRKRKSSWTYEMTANPMTQHENHKLESISEEDEEEI